MKLKASYIILFVFVFLGPARTQSFYFGNDLSYVNQMEDCGAVYKENMLPKDPFKIFADHGTNLVRVRLWLDPSWWQGKLVQPQGVKPYYNDYQDVKKTIQRAKNAGMQVMLDIHYSDFWADPGHQLIPRSWLDVAYNLPALKDSVYNYTVRVLRSLDSAGLMPEIVKVGNENNPGILKHIPADSSSDISATVSNSWARHGELYNAAIKAIRDVGKTASINPRIAVHFSGTLSSQYGNFYNLIHNAGVTDFDILGFSYYYAWQYGSISELESTVKSLVSSFPAYKVMAVETGYLWSTLNFDELPNIITLPDPQYLPVIPEKQLEYMVDYSRAVMRAGGIGVVFWEPAWVSTACVTPWGKGSSQEHVAFFDPDSTNFMENGGGHWMESRFYQNVFDKKLTIKVDMTGQDVSKGVYISGSFTGDSWQILPMANEGNNIYSYFTYLPSGQTGGFYFLNGNTRNSREIIADQCSFQDSLRLFRVSARDTKLGYKWGSCESLFPLIPDSVKVTFAVDMGSIDISNGVYVTGAMTGTSWQILPLTHAYGTIYTRSFFLIPGDKGAFYFLTTPVWTNYLNFRETIPAICAAWYGSDRGYTVPAHDTSFALKWASCDSFDLNAKISLLPGETFRVYPNPVHNLLYVYFGDNPVQTKISLFDVDGNEVKSQLSSNGNSSARVDVSDLSSAIYVLRIITGNRVLFKKINIQ